MAHSNDPSKFVPQKEWTPAEREALGHAFDMAGQFVENQLGCRTDFATWSPDEFQLFVNVICLAFTDRVRELTTSDEVPF